MKKLYKKVLKQVLKKSEMLSDSDLIKLRYYMIFDKHIDLENPKTFNEKLQWFKLYDHNEKYHTLVDKYAVRDFVAEKIGEEYLIPLCGGPWNSVEEIDFSSLPEQFVIKCTHDSQSVTVCRDKASADIDAIKNKLSKAMKADYYKFGREWAYKDVKPRIVAEKMIIDSEGNLPNDYKFFCFKGQPKMIQVDYDRFSGHKRRLYSADWEIIPCKYEYADDEKHEIEKPPMLENMLEVCRKLSEGLEFVRVDLYNVDGKIYFGEMTFYPESGFGHIVPEKYNELWGSWIELPR